MGGTSNRGAPDFVPCAHAMSMYGAACAALGLTLLLSALEDDRDTDRKTWHLVQAPSLLVTL